VRKREKQLKRPAQAVTIVNPFDVWMPLPGTLF
jgi:hypothetical protein